MSGPGVLSTLTRRQDQTVLPSAIGGDTRDAPSLMETAGASMRSVADDSWFVQDHRLNDAYQPVVSALRERDGSGYWDYARSPIAQSLVPFDDEVWDGKAIWRAVERARKSDPAAFSELPKTREEFERTALRRGDARSRDLDTVSRGGMVAGFAGGMVGSFADPVNGAGLVIGGGGKTVAQRVLTEGLVNAALETATLPGTAQARAAMGEELTLGEAATRIAMAGAGGMVFRGGIEGGAKALPAIDRAGYNAMRPVREMIDGVFADRDLARAFADAVPEHVRTPEQQAALNVLVRQADIDDASPFARTYEGYAAHEARLRQAEDALVNGRPLAPRAKPAPLRPARELDVDGFLNFAVDALEGGGKVVSDTGGVTRWGISSKANPGIDVARLSRAAAMDIYREKYVAPLDLAGRNGDVAEVAIDASINHGPGFAKRLLEVADDPTKMIALRRAEYARLLREDPAKYGKYAEGWENRLRKLEGRLGLRRGEAAASAPGRIADEGDGDMMRALEAERADIDAARTRLDEEMAAPRSEADWAADIEAAAPVPPLQRDLFPDTNSWRVAQAAQEAETLGLSEPMVTWNRIGQEAVQKLLRERDGEVNAAFHHPEIGTIDFVWGKPGDAARDFKGGSGIAHIEAKHGHEGILDDLPQRLSEMKVVARTTQRGRPKIQLEGPRGHATISEDWHGAERRWLLTAFDPEWKPSPGKRAGRMPDADGPGSARREGSADIGEAAPVRNGPAAAAPAKTPRALEDFDDPAGPGVARAMDSTWHDIRMRMEAEPDAKFDLGDGKGERSAREILDELEADDADIAAIKGCMPGGMA
ncbi:glycosyl hydrolase 108 family protein [Croceicoccus mobilis]|uniref:TtsA-like Glycoside hydrolase family 108 domain-containing protein n=1 Tax=Croceicoccus mobilis TaxID=1703339 RepID=A0A917DWS1_9SPHN|nr:glycosyl hydrolase 108 family protein [Croceicoccus mobilis]GGD73856.1 hypothetical protein GCM10010990_24350 [Croceicoccus mobilis]